MSEIILRVTDIETSGLDPAKDEIVEIGYTDVVFDTETKVCTIGLPWSKLFRPMRGIPPEVVAIHHLRPVDLEAYDQCTPADISEALDGPFAIVAHNAAFDASFLDPLQDHRWIDTLKGASRVWPEAPGYGNQVLRYYRDLPVDLEVADPPHRAGPDTHVTAHILAALLAETSVSQLVRWTNEPRFLPKCPLPKHKGQSWEEIPADYLAWITRTADMSEDIKHAARSELERRSAG